MGISRAQYLQGNNAEGLVLSNSVQGVTAGTGIQINANGILSISPATTTTLGGVIPDGVTISVSPTGVISTLKTSTIANLNILEAPNGVRAVFTLVEYNTSTPFTPSSSSNIAVFLGGVPQLPTSSYTISGNQIFFSDAPPSGTTFLAITVKQV